jgi:predicted NBD/HSP70 family sugar kinase
MARRLRSGSRGLIREINQSLVLGIIRDQGPISRTDIARLADLSPATITEISSILIENGLIHEQEEGMSTGGRRPILLALNRQAGLVLGAKLTDREIVSALIDLDGEIVDQQTAPLAVNATVDQVIDGLAALVGELRGRHAGKRIFGLGLGMAGVVDRRTGFCRFSPYFRWHDVPLGQMLEQRLGLPVVLDNDVNTLTLAEQWFGAGAGMADFLVVTLGRGVGMGMVLNGQLYRGSNGGAGEFGHSTIQPDGPLCDCGKRGCLEALVSTPALLRRFRERFNRDLTMDDALALAREGDLVARQLFSQAGATLGLALSQLVNIFNPPLLIVGGEGASAADLFLDPLRESLERHSFDGFFNDLKLVVEGWGDDAWARGAAGLMIEEMFRPSLYRDEEHRPTFVPKPEPGPTWQGPRNPNLVRG